MQPPVRVVSCRTCADTACQYPADEQLSAALSAPAALPVLWRPPPAQCGRQLNRRQTASANAFARVIGQQNLAQKGFEAAHTPLLLALPL